MLVCTADQTTISIFSACTIQLLWLEQLERRSVKLFHFTPVVSIRDLRGQPAPRGFAGPEFSLSLAKRGGVRVDITRASAGCHSAGACEPRAALVRAYAGRSGQEVSVTCVKTDYPPFSEVWTHILPSNAGPALYQHSINVSSWMSPLNPHSGWI